MAKKVIKTVITTVLTLILVGLVAFFLTMAVAFSPVEIVGESMNNTLFDGEVLYMRDKVDIDYNDIIIIEDEKGTGTGELIIKRVYALGGDTVKVADGKLLIKYANSSEFTPVSEEHALLPENYEYESHWLNVPYTLSDDEVFYLGDNRANSSDSRGEFGCCKTSQVVGEITDFSLKIKGFSTWWFSLKDKVRTFFGLEPQLYKNL